MSYAARFKVGAWLETPAKWLSWAVDSAANVKDAEWNLSQFWSALNAVKPSAKTTAQWAEILLLDSRGQSTLGHHLLYKAALQAKSASVYSVDAAWARAFALGPYGVASLLNENVRSFLAKNDPGLTGYKATVQRLHDQAGEAFAKASDMAKQAAKASADATAAKRLQEMAKTGTIVTQNSQGQMVTTINDIATSAGPRLSDLSKALTVEMFGVPAWVWALGGIAVALAITTGPSVVTLNRARRLAA